MNLNFILFYFYLQLLYPGWPDSAEAGLTRGPAIYIKIIIENNIAILCTNIIEYIDKIK